MRLILESYWKTVCEGRQSEDAHRAFLRYGVGEYEREKVSLRKTRKNITLLTGYDHVWLQYGLSTKLPGKKHVHGVLITPDAERKTLLTQWLDQHGITIEKTFGKKITLAQSTLTAEAYEALISFLTQHRIYPFLTITTSDGLVKVKKTTFPKPKEDLAKRENFIRLEAPLTLWDAFLSAFPLAEGAHQAYMLTASLTVHSVEYDETLLQEDPDKAWEESKRHITARLGMKKDSKLEQKECTFTI